MTAWYNENDKYAAQWLRNLIDAGHIAPGVVDERSIEAVHPADLEGFTQCHFFAGIGVWSHALRLAGWADDRPVWTGSCPCQPFSDAGAGAAFDDKRHLWPHWFHLIERAKPRAVPVFGEQVASKDGLAWLDLVHADMEGAKHTVGAVDLCAAGIGAPHIRQRFFFVGHPDEGRGRRHARTVPRAQGEVGRRLRRVADSAEPAGATGLLDNADNADNARLEGWLGSSSGADQRAAGASGVAGALADDDSARWPACEPGLRLRGADLHDADGRSPISGFWAGADWIACRDGKWRAVRPGSFPLAHEPPARVGRLRAYGNAIVAEAAAAFIGAYLATTASGLWPKRSTRMTR